MAIKGMNPYEQKLQQFLSENGVQAEHLSFDCSCHSVEEAAAAAEASIDDLVKNICMVNSEGKIIVAIVKGES
ncbi:MAG: hypothetical protein AAFN08_16790, partial [Cyanobacteria bacterium J06559_3]